MWCAVHVCAGGGGSINYTMMHESSDWLAQQLGAGGQYSAAYWDTLKQDIGEPGRQPVCHLKQLASSTSSSIGPAEFWRTTPRHLLLLLRLLLLVSAYAYATPT
jgi:hypothetical protein